MGERLRLLILGNPLCDLHLELHSRLGELSYKLLLSLAGLLVQDRETVKFVLELIFQFFQMLIFVREVTHQFREVEIFICELIVSKRVLFEFVFEGFGSQSVIISYF